MLNFWNKKTIYDQKSYDIRAKEICFHNRPNCEKPCVGGKVVSTEVGRQYKVEVDWKLINSSEHRIQLYAILAGFFLFSNKEGIRVMLS